MCSAPDGYYIILNFLKGPILVHRLYYLLHLLFVYPIFYRHPSQFEPRKQKGAGAIT